VTGPEPTDRDRDRGENPDGARDRDGNGRTRNDDESRRSGETLPVPVSNEAVRTTYDRWSSLYADTVARLETPSKRRALDLLDPDPGTRVLDLGCGPGLTLPDLADRVGADGAVYALDAAPGMLAEAADRVRESTLADRVSVLGGDARRLPFAAGSVDAVVAFDVLELFDRTSLSVVLGEIRRVLAPEGTLRAVTMDRADLECSRFLRGYEWAYRHAPWFARVGCRPFDVRATIREAGFRVESSERSRRIGVWPVVTVCCRPKGNDRIEPEQ
jgi:demethylmenaquinone methyltransferase/2-methoxy-6-polyprenyl-1,4-benzoquinol methylase